MQNTKPMEASPALKRLRSLEESGAAGRLGALSSTSSRPLVEDWLRFCKEVVPVVDALVRPNRGLFDHVAHHVRLEAVKAHCALDPPSRLASSSASAYAAVAAAELDRLLKVLDAYLGLQRRKLATKQAEESNGSEGGSGSGPRSTFLLAGTPCTADIALACVLCDPFAVALPSALRVRYLNVGRWLDSCLQLPACQDLVPAELTKCCRWPRQEETAFEERVDAASELLLAEAAGRQNGGGEEAWPSYRLPKHVLDVVPTSTLEALGFAAELRQHQVNGSSGGAAGSPPKQEAESSGEKINGKPSPVEQLGAGLLAAAAASSSSSSQPRGKAPRMLPPPGIGNAGKSSLSLGARIRGAFKSFLQDVVAEAVDDPRAFGTVFPEFMHSPPQERARSSRGGASASLNARPGKYAGVGFSKNKKGFGGNLYLSREDYLTKHIHVALHVQVRELLQAQIFTDVEFEIIGRTPFRDQLSLFPKLRETAMANRGIDVAAVREEAVGSANVPAIKSKMCYRCLQTGHIAKECKAEVLPDSVDRGERVNFAFLDQDDDEEDKFWWKEQQEALCFDLALTDEADLGRGVPQVQQWWDVHKVGESDNFVAVAKPAGMFVITDNRGLWEESPTNFIHVVHQRFDIGDARNEPRQRGLCHRLDSHTSGCQIFGKSWEAFRHFMNQNMKHRVQKEYLALVDGRLGGAESDNEDVGYGIIDVPMQRYANHDQREFGSVVCELDGMPAVTKYKCLRQWRIPGSALKTSGGRERWVSLVQLRIMTGRTHQIRIHMAFIGHPLVGDVKYRLQNCEEDNALVPRIFLHCLRMEFEDMDGSAFIASSDLAPDLQAALARIQRLSEDGASPQAAQDQQQCGHAAQGGREGCSSGGAAAAAPNAPPAWLRRPKTCMALPGLAGILDTSVAQQPEAFEPATSASGEETLASLRFQCRCHWGWHRAKKRRLVRDDRAAMLYTLEAEAASLAAADVGKEAVPESSLEFAKPEDGWGAGMLWVPRELMLESEREAIEAKKADGEQFETTATPEELGAWGFAQGAEWCWAHDGQRVNGWMRFLTNNTLLSKWGMGYWRLVPPPRDSKVKPVMLVTFAGVEHALRLAGREERKQVSNLDKAVTPMLMALQDRPFFVVAAKTRPTVPGDAHWTEDPAYEAVLRPGGPVCCETRGWPKG
eukprot:TRINITY_DN9211_c0_g1_i2.p1 TRINITY_DN9211_c0_g1~~TRINITY_DN9211_c0_g1_i2.p1  ORF type:complete len:1170 (+),score=303.41 TRINITY_DN9211_c0_g1_i2:96-3605(+)